MIRSFDGKMPRIATTAFVHEAACIIGDVEVGEDSSIWPGAVIRGDFTSIKIGRNTLIEDNSVIHGGEPVEIGDNVILGHGAVTHCSRVGDNTLVGSNATILNNVRVGSFCIIAAGSVLSPGMVVPDGSFVVGVPARIRGSISAEQRAMLEHASDSYRDVVRRYRAQGG